MRDLRRAFGFFTIVPLSRHEEDIKEVAASCYLLPLVAVVTGSVAGLSGWGASSVWNEPVAAAITLALLLLVTGFHHADGLADYGDALMARGDRSRRIDVLKDRALGVGGVGAMLLTYLASWAALLDLFDATEGYVIILYVVGAEISARLALLLTALMSSPSHEGSGSAFIVAVRGWRGIVGVALSLLLLAALAIPAHGTVPIFAAAAALIVAVAMALAGRQWFGGVGGDLLGASVELGRLAALLALAAALQQWPG